MKQSKLRRKRVFRYAVLYFVMLIVFVGLIVGPIVAGKKIPASVFTALKGTDLVQPTGQINDDTIGSTETGTASPGYTGAGTSTMTTGGGGSSTTTAAAKLRLF